MGLKERSAARAERAAVFMFYLPEPVAMRGKRVSLCVLREARDHVHVCGLGPPRGLNTLFVEAVGGCELLKPSKPTPYALRQS